MLVFVLLVMPSAFAQKVGSHIEIIPTAYGCEDFALDDKSQESQRLLVSCDDRRGKHPEVNGLYTLDLISHEFKRIAISGIGIESFHPHGIYLLENDRGSWLYVINHQYKKENSQRRSFSQILLFKVKAERLDFVMDLGEAEGASAFELPNDLFVMPNGEIYLANSLSLRHSLLHYSPESQRWTTLARGYVFANGVHVKDKVLYLHDSFSGKQLAFDVRPSGTLENRRVSARRLGAVDNITENASGDLLYAGAKKLGGYLRYYIAPGYRPESLVARQHGETLQVLAGSLRQTIRTPSVAFEYGDRLYLGQVFEGFIAVITDPNWIDRK